MAKATSTFRIHGGKPLEGEIRVKGMKNAATPIIAATILIRDKVTLRNMPRLSDVERMFDILRSIGTEVEWTGDDEVVIDATKADIASIDEKAVKAMRSSILVLGALLSRFHAVRIPEPGGCIIGNRPIDAHLVGLQQLGARVVRENDMLDLSTDGLVGSTVILPQFSVTATENLIIAAALAKGTTTVHMAAAEPHVQDLIDFLNAAGADIRWAGQHILEIVGVEKLHGVTHRIIADQIEAGTFAVLGALTKGTLRVTGVDHRHMHIITLLLRTAGVDFDVEDDAYVMRSGGSLKALPAHWLKALPYPGFPTDLQAPFGVLATQCQGTTLIQDPLYEGRLGYINELIKMGANATICDPHRVLVSGPTPLYGQEIQSLDLRAGATLVIAGLVAQGVTHLHQAQILDRGYDRFDERLRAVGADIQRIEE
jgi:UDP-N-acetylglucosamine 1-carboxyvinyltransferase